MIEAPFLKRLSFRNKLLFSYIVLISIPITISSIYFFNKVITSVSRNSMEIVGQRLSQEESGLQNQLNQLEQAARFFDTNPIFNKYFDNNYYNDIERIVITNNYIIPLISWQASMNNNINSIRFLTDDDNIPEGEFIEWNNRHPADLWFDPMRRAVENNGLFWENIHQPRKYHYQKPGTLPQVYSMFTKLQGFSSQTPTFLEIEINPDYLFNTINLQPIGRTGYIVVTDRQKSIISGPESKRSGNVLKTAKLLARIRLNEHTERVTVNHITYVAAVKKINKLDTYLIGIVPLNEILEPLVRTRNIFIGIISAGLILLSVLAYLIAGFLLRRVKRILEAVRKIQQGDFLIRLPAAGGDEIDELADDINLMADKINELFNQVYKAEIAQKEAIINALQMQINPHFIFNTLETLKMMAEIRDEEELSEGLTALGNLIRYNTSIGSKFVTICREIENVRDYLKIQNLLLNNRLQVDFQIDETLYEWSMPNLVIQPLVENCIIHGYKDREDRITILIAIAERHNDIVIHIRDYGKGIPADRLKQIREVLNENIAEQIPGTNQKGIGLANVNKRLKLYFGMDYGLVIANGPDCGTKVSVRIPIT
ncbi:MAG TPA: hypothetical protein DDW65_02825 [Firmicutes bacterium]|jgi:two-component system, sensor histidine kinase YesM|nr:hypothetical protein [Bacillota bacterium]